MKTKHKFALGALLVVSVGIIGGTLQNSKSIEYERPDVTSTVATTTEVLERDVVSEAQAELERINAELDAEETRLLEEIEAIQLKAQSQVAEREQRLEQIRETRVSF
jgi:molybdenum-dependent DNA-binding transcriptional regulator ModE